MEIIKQLAKTNSKDYNFLKTAEELTELVEVLLKKLAKAGSIKEPSNDSVIEEIGDCKIRLMILEEIFGKEEVQKRVDYKLSKYKEYLEQDKYIGRI